MALNVARPFRVAFVGEAEASRYILVTAHTGRPLFSFEV